MIRAGRLRHRAAFQEASSTTNTFGEQTETWDTYEFAWIGVEPLQGRERSESQQVTPEVSHKVRRRYSDRVTSAHRILWKSAAPEVEDVILMADEGKRTLFGSRVLEIDGALDMFGRGRELNLLCKEGA